MKELVFNLITGLGFLVILALAIIVFVLMAAAIGCAIDMYRAKYKYSFCGCNTSYCDKSGDCSRYFYRKQCWTMQENINCIGFDKFMELDDAIHYRQRIK